MSTGEHSLQRILGEDSAIVVRRAFMTEPDPNILAAGIDLTDSLAFYSHRGTLRRNIQKVLGNRDYYIFARVIKDTFGISHHASLPRNEWEYYEGLFLRSVWDYLHFSLASTLSTLHRGCAA